MDTIQQLLESNKSPEDFDNLKKTIEQIKDITVQNPIDHLLKNWEKKINCFSNVSDQKIVATLLENTHNFHKKQFNNKFNFTEPPLVTEEEKQIFEKQINFLEMEKKNAEKTPLFAKINLQIEKLQNEYNELLKKEHELKLENRFEMRGVNISDEIIKFYDYLVMKKVVGVQPMYGPVGFAYALRFRATSVPTFTEESEKECLESTFKAPENYKSKKDMIEYKPSEVGLTIEQKEVMAQSRKIKIPDNEKISGKMLARTVNGELLASILVNFLESDVELIRNNPDQHSTKTETEDILIQMKDIANKTRMGKANYVLLLKETYEAMKPLLLMDKPPLLMDKPPQPIFVDEFNYNTLKPREYILCYGGDKNNDKGLIYAPYIPFMVIDHHDSLKLMSRYAIMHQLFGSNLYYSFHILSP